jgi:hypothetical protein
MEQRMRDISSDLRERLEATVKQRTELEVRERHLRALLRDEKVSHARRLQPASRRVSNEATDVPRLREFVLGSLKDGHDWSLEGLKQHARGIGLTTSGALGRALNITLVNLLGEGLVMRLQGGKWRLRDQSTQLDLDLAPANSDPERDSAEASTLLAS